MKVGVYVAHDDDAILGVGGRIVQHLERGDDVFVVIFTDGRNSHKAVLGIEIDPSVWQVKRARGAETVSAMKILGVPKERLYFLDQTDGEGEIWQSERALKVRVVEITMKESPDIVYFHFPDAHPDHRATAQVMSEVLRELEPRRPKAYQFFIWTKELAEGRPEVDASKVPAIPSNALRIGIRRQLEEKRQALHQMQSQTNVWPYPGWQLQARPILPDYFINHFLKGEEVFVKSR